MKILVSVIVVVLLVLVAAEFGLRAYVKGQIADRVKDSASDQGIELSGDPSVSLGSSPLLLGMVRGKLPEVTMDLPSSLQVSYEDNDRSRPVISGQPAATVTAKDVESSGDNPLIGDLGIDADVPQDYLLAVIQQAMAENRASGNTGDGAAGALAGLAQITGVTPDKDAGNLDIEISGGLATVSMTPTVVDGVLNFDVADVKILGLSLPDELTAGITDSLRRSVAATDNLAITGAEVTDDGLAVHLSGQDIRIGDIASEVDAITVATVNDEQDAGTPATTTSPAAPEAPGTPAPPAAPAAPAAPESAAPAAPAAPESAAPAAA